MRLLLVVLVAVASAVDFSFTLKQLGPCNATDVPIYCWSEGVTQNLTVLLSGTDHVVFHTVPGPAHSGVLRLDATIDEAGETGTLTLKGTNSSLLYKALSSSHVTTSEQQWAGFMAGEITGGTGFYSKAVGVVTFTARQVDSNSCLPPAKFCYAKFVSVQGFLP
jgi:hypothetical protein